MPRAKSATGGLTNVEEAAIQAGIAEDTDNPELTDEQLQGLRPAAEVLPPGLYAALVKRARGRPPSETKKIEVKLRLDPSIVAAFKADGPGWQTRMNAALERAIRPDASTSMGKSERSVAGRAARPGLLRKRPA